MFKVQVFVSEHQTCSSGARFDKDGIIQIFTSRWPSLASLHVLGHEIAHGFVPHLQLHEGTFGEMVTTRNRIMQFLEEWMCHIAGVPCFLWYLLSRQAREYYRVEVIYC